MMLLELKAHVLDAQGKRNIMEFMYIAYKAQLSAPLFLCVMKLEVKRGELGTFTIIDERHRSDLVTTLYDTEQNAIKAVLKDNPTVSYFETDTEINLPEPSDYEYNKDIQSFTQDAIGFEVDAWRYMGEMSSEIYSRLVMYTHLI